MNGIIGTFRIGEELTLALDASAGDTAAVSAISALMKPALVTANRLVLDDAASPVALVVTPQSPASAGWTISLGHSQSALLEPGIYGIDAKLTLASSVEITEQSAFVSLSRAAVA